MKAHFCEIGLKTMAVRTTEYLQSLLNLLCSHPRGEIHLSNCVKISSLRGGSNLNKIHGPPRTEENLQNWSRGIGPSDSTAPQSVFLNWDIDIHSYSQCPFSLLKG